MGNRQSVVSRDSFRCRGFTERIKNTTAIYRGRVLSQPQRYETNSLNSSDFKQLENSFQNKTHLLLEKRLLKCWNICRLYEHSGVLRKPRVTYQGRVLFIVYYWPNRLVKNSKTCHKETYSSHSYVRRWTIHLRWRHHSLPS